MTLSRSSVFITILDQNTDYFYIYMYVYMSTSTYKYIIITIIKFKIACYFLYKAAGCY